MKAQLLKGPGEVVLVEVPIPKISDDEVLVQVKYCGICGSDVHAVPDCIIHPAGSYQGHEFSGVIAEAGKNVGHWKPEDRVTANPLYACGECWYCRHGFESQCEHCLEKTIGIGVPGAFAKFVRVPFPGQRLYSLPEEVSFEEGALVEPLANALSLIKKSTFGPGDHVMVLGAGPIGLGVIMLLKYAGAGLIIATEVVGKRAELASKFGADYVFHPQKVSNLKERVFELTNGRGVDVVFDCSGTPAAFQSATTFLRARGQVMVMGLFTAEVPVCPMDWAIREYGLQGVLGYGSDEFPMVISYLKRGSSPYKEVVTSKIKLSNIVEDGFNVLAKPGYDEIKILVEPDE